ncbi:MAG: OsmC family protein [Betaproteobacteria bacterium]
MLEDIWYYIVNRKERIERKSRRKLRLPESVLTKLGLVERYRFKVEFDVEGVPNLVVDEMKPIGEGLGPNPTRMLSAAVGHCLSSSLLYCLGRAKVKVTNLDTIVKADVERNEEGYLRVAGLDVQIHLEVNEKDKIRVPRCLSIFENYCTVTQSIRKGIEVKVNTEFS